MKVNDKLLCDRFPVLYQIRRCYQEELSIVVCNQNCKDCSKYCYYFDELIEFKGLNFGKCRTISLLEHRVDFKKTEIDSEVFIVGGSYKHYHYYLKEVEVYSKITKKRRFSNRMPAKLYGFSVTSFKRELFVIGGCHSKHSRGYTSSCLKYDVKNDEWSYIAGMNGVRQVPGCTVFKGKIVAYGGHFEERKLKPVETYDHHENKWSHLPDILEKRSGHFSVSLGNKLFVLSNCFSQFSEVFDSISRKFNFIKPPSFLKTYSIKGEQTAYCVGNNIVLFNYYHKFFVVYDTIKSEWWLKLFTAKD